MSEEQLDLLDWRAGQPSCSSEVMPTLEDAPAERHVTQVRLTRADRARNMHRFYSLELAISLFGECGVARPWGRIGTAGRSRTDWYDRPDEAESAFQDLLSRKQRRGYAC